MINQELLREYRFQRRHGGGWVGHHAEGCLRAARAYLVLQEARDAGVAEVEWMDDEDPDPSWMDQRELDDLNDGRTCLLSCVVWIEGQPAASVGGVHVGSRGVGEPYCHIIESELASECLETLQEALRGVEDTADIAY